MKKWTIVFLCSLYLWTAATCKGYTIGQLCTTPSGIPGTLQSPSNCLSLQNSFGQSAAAPIVCCPHQIFTRAAVNARRSRVRNSGRSNAASTPVPNLRFAGCGEGGPPQQQRRIRSTDGEERYHDSSEDPGDESATEYDYPDVHNMTTSMIIGGSTATPHAWPWMAGLMERRYSRYRIFCGGTLITNYFVVSAAHCVRQGRRTRKDFAIQLGAHTLSDGTVYGVEATYVHPQYRNFYNDISLIKLKTPVVFTAHVKPVCLPSPQIAVASFEGKDAWIVGWGATREGGGANPVLKQAQVKVTSRKQCNLSYSRRYGRRNVITDYQLCASAPGRDSCQGDSGGPLVIYDELRKWTLIGVTCFGYGCARPGYAGVYTRVGAYYGWLLSELARNN